MGRLKSCREQMIFKIRVWFISLLFEVGPNSWEMFPTLNESTPETMLAQFMKGVPNKEAEECVSETEI